MRSSISHRSLLSLLFLYAFFESTRAGAEEPNKKDPTEPLLVTDTVEFKIKIGKSAPGTVKIGLFRKVVPITVENFFELSKRPVKKGYVKSIFHRVIKDFVIQGGDYTLGNGEGGKSIYDGKDFKDENFLLHHYGKGWVSMANAGPNTNGSQFFITLMKLPKLDGKYVVFGKVLEGMAFVEKISLTPTNKKDDKPIENVVIVSCHAQTVAKPFPVTKDDAKS